MTWTWIIYLATHNDAADAGAASLDRVRAAALGAGVRVLAQQATPSGTSRHLFGDGAPRSSDIGATDAGDPATLLDCVRWAVQEAPAERYALVLWSHGSGWEPSEMARLAQQAPPTPVPVTAGELQQRAASGEDGRRVFFSSSMRRLLQRPTPAERAIAFDDGSGHSLDAVELGGVVRNAATLLGRPLDLLGMNACQMASAEVAYEARAGARVFVASQEDMPAESWPYDDILPRLVAQPDMDAAVLGKLIVERYCAFFPRHQPTVGERRPASGRHAQRREPRAHRAAGAIRAGAGRGAAGRHRAPARGGVGRAPRRARLPVPPSTTSPPSAAPWPRSPVPRPPSSPPQGPRSPP